jgi:carbonic anhydrase/acetyltransferase-like protein (isoleucine patch superfamily)
MPIYALGANRPLLPQDGHYWIAPDAHVIGSVRIGQGVSIWFGAVVRGDNEPIEIGDDSNLQEGVMLHADPTFPLTIGRGVTVGHHAILHGCTIGENSLIGMGATVLNGAVIGRDCLIGANALVTESKSFEDGSLIVGAPARSIRKLEADEIERNRRTANGYVQRARQFANELRRLD